MAIAKRVLALLGGLLLLFPLPSAPRSWPLLILLGVAIAVLVQRLGRRRALRKRVVLAGAVLGAAVAAATSIGPVMMSGKYDPSPEQQAKSRAEALARMPAPWRDLMAAQQGPPPSGPSGRAMKLFSTAIAVEMLAMVAGGYVASGLCLLAYGALGPAWRRGPVVPTDPEAVGVAD